ncbi:hypothetical protein TL16_g09628 [Triparma laevis f. inornata]|uniref:Uncharacterized protein n=1 Tax=Triparma laevis f. inornata TaxID=1714386 RepID=A0A9W7EMS8_9STRA|nr:hypothetical protein TL16_g09628 [Triparma laevis f. inornata]
MADSLPDSSQPLMNVTDDKTPGDPETTPISPSSSEIGSEGTADIKTRRVSPSDVLIIDGASSTHSGSQDDDVVDESSITDRQRALKKIGEFMSRTLLPDTISISRFNLTFPPSHVKPIKFFLTTYLLILFSHWWICQNPSWGQNKYYTLERFYLYDFNEVLLDSLWFFILGRYWSRKGVDSPLFIFSTLFGQWFFAILDTFDWAKYSLSKYDIMCRWPWQLFLFTGFIILLVTFLTCLHILRAFHDKILLGRLFEIFLCIYVFVLPIAADSSTHYHHWFTAWFIGQHANQEYWWSIACSALLWGGYINGIASWGRGAMLGCKEGFWMTVGSQ